jgi:hypothetical protein
VRAFERLDGESAKAYSAFCVYRDLGSERSLQKAAEIVYGSGAKRGQLERWSSKFDWVARCRTYDDWKEMLVQSAIAEREQQAAGDVAAREAKLREDALEVRELAARKVKIMLKWPLLEEVVRRDVDGREVEVHYHPARWSLATVPGLVAIMRGREDDVPADELGGEIDTSELSNEEIETLLAIERKIRFKRPDEARHR